jgi:Lrp/AsnC family transcriptional regulator, leucine-responsive regulatory protein
MNRSRYANRTIDKTDHIIVASLFENGRMTFRELGDIINMSGPSVKDHFNKLMDAGAILGFTAIIDPMVFGYSIAVHLRINAKPGEVMRIEQLLDETPQVVEAHRITGDGCFVASAYVTDMAEVERVAARFEPFASTDVSVIQSTTVTRRLPKI